MLYVPLNAAAHVAGLNYAQNGLGVAIISAADLSDGEKLTATQPDYNNPGTQIMILSYEGVSDTFEITVKAKEAPAPDPNQNTTPDPNQNTTPDPGQNNAPDPNQNTVPEPNNGGEKKSAGFVPYVCAAAGVIVGGAAVYFITRKKK